jgi:ABC-type Fe3+ transport system permease subunit
MTTSPTPPSNSDYPDPSQAPPPMPPPQVPGSPPQRPRKRRRIFRWVFLVVQVLFLIWIITGIASSSGSDVCTGLTGQDLQTCNDAGSAGTAIGVGLIIFLWAAVDIILAICWLVFRRRS